MKKYDEEKIKCILEEYDASHSVKEICQKYGIVKSTLYNWKRASRKVKPGAYSSKLYSAWEIDLMKRKLDELKINNDILCRAGCSIDAPLEEKLKAVDKLKGDYKISRICKTLKLAKSTYYNRQLNKGKPSSYQQADEQLKPFIQQYFYLSGKRFGAAKIKIMLEMNHNLHVSKERIQKLMRDMGLKSKQTLGVKARSVKRKVESTSDYLQRNFISLKPNKVWVSDITYIPVNNELCALCVIIDLFARKVIAHKVAENATAELVVQTFLEAWKVRKPRATLIFHSDQGCQFKAGEFSELLKQKGVIQSFADTGCPINNAVVEGFFSVMKREEISHHYFKSCKTVEKVVSEYIHFFNELRPMKKLNNMSPVQFETHYYDACHVVGNVKEDEKSQ